MKKAMTGASSTYKSQFLRILLKTTDRLGLVPASLAAAGMEVCFDKTPPAFVLFFLEHSRALREKVFTVLSFSCGGLGRIKKR
jgi:hypothetical protein